MNGLNLYYDIHGTGQLLVLLHGALSSTETSFGKLLPALAATRGPGPRRPATGS